MKLKFPGIPDKDVVAYSEGVLATLEKLKFDYLAEEFSPPDKKGEVTYSVLNVKGPKK